MINIRHMKVYDAQQVYSFVARVNGKLYGTFNAQFQLQILHLEPNSRHFFIYLPVCVSNIALLLPQTKSQAKLDLIVQ